MLDSAIKDQLKTVFAALENEVVLVHNTNNSHVDQAELIQMLEDVASTSDKIKVKKITESKLTKYT